VFAAKCWAECRDAQEPNENRHETHVLNAQVMLIILEPIDGWSGTASRRQSNGMSQSRDSVSLSIWRACLRERVMGSTL
jgi:hypothetical protein